MRTGCPRFLHDRRNSAARLEGHINDETCSATTSSPGVPAALRLARSEAVGDGTGVSKKEVT
jgi:hypothetical protein